MRSGRHRAGLGNCIARLKTSAAALFFVCVACSQRAPQPIAEIRGEPINSSPRSNAALPLPTSSAPPNSAIADPLLVGFDKLSSYKFEPGEDLLNPQTNRVVRTADSLIPDRVKSYNNQHVAIRGFMLPLKVEGGAVIELLIMRDQSMCCYGVVPKINEWICVKMKSKGVKAIMDQPVTIYGTLHVGEMRENGYLVGIYNFDGEKMELTEN